MHSNTALHCHLVCLEWQRLTWSPSHSTSRKTSQKQISSITPMTIRAFHCYLQRGMKQETMGGASTGDFGLNSVSDPCWLWHCNVLWHTEFHLPHLKNGTSKIYLANLLWRNWAKVLGQEWTFQKNNDSIYYYIFETIKIWLHKIFSFSKCDICWSE